MDSKQYGKIIRHCSKLTAIGIGLHRRAEDTAWRLLDGLASRHAGQASNHKVAACFSASANFKSASTMIFTSSLNFTLGSQPS